MTHPAVPAGLVLIVERDDAISSLLTVVLQRAGYETLVVRDSAAGSTECDAIVRDLNLAPAARRQSLSEVSATAPALLRRTIFATTTPDRVMNSIPAGSAFAVIAKPFDLHELLELVEACVARSRDERAAIEPVRRFVRTAPVLHRLLDEPAISERELLLRDEMRRTVAALQTTLLEAARVEPNHLRAAAYRAASHAAARIATPRSRAARRDH